MAQELDTSIQYLSGVGPKRAELLERELGIKTLSDLIHLYPFRYIDRSGILPVAQVAPDLAFVQIQATVVSRTLYGPNSAVVSQETNPIHWGAVKRLSVMVEDASGRMEMVFFKGIRWNFQRLVPGSTFLFFGKPQAFGQRLNIVHPEVDVPQDGAMSQGGPDGRLSQHGEAQDGRHHRQGDVQAPVRRPLPLPAGDPGDAAGVHPARPGARLPALCAQEHPFPEGQLRPAEGDLPAEIRGTLLPAAEPAEAEIRPLARRARHPDAQGRSRLPRLLQRPSLQSDGRAAAGDQGDPRRSDERPPDEPPAAGRRGLRQDHGGRAQLPDRHRQRLPDLHHGPHRGAGPAALCQYPEIPEADFRTLRPADRQHDAEGAARHPRRAGGRQHRHHRGHARPAGRQRHFQEPRPRRHRRAAPFRRGAAGELWGKRARTCLRTCS